MAQLGLTTVRIDVLSAAVEPEPGRFDEDHLAVVDQILDAARRHGLTLHPALLIGNEVGDAYWAPGWPDRPTRTPTRAWTGQLADAVRAADPGHLVTIGTASPPGPRRSRPPWPAAPAGR
jgi:hypothetical protein